MVAGYESLRYSNTHIHDWTDETASGVVRSQVGLRVFVYVFLCVHMYVLNMCARLRLHVYRHPFESVRLQHHFLVPGSALIRTRSSQDLNALQIEETISALLFYNQ